VTGAFAPCAHHADAWASFRCAGCGRALCYDCVDEEAASIVCRECGGVAEPIDEATPEPPVEPEPELVRPEHLDHAELDRADAEEAAFDHDPLLLLVRHVVIPAAVIAMVSALLYFLLQLRAVVVGPARALGWLGLCFTTATVLIVRYGRTDGDAGRQGCYTAGLLGATLVALVASPWESPGAGPAGPAVNALILLLVWRFATEVTRGLSLEGEDWSAPRPRFYGLERRALEEWRRRQRPRRAGDRTERKKDERAERHARRRPAVAVARLAAPALGLFAVGEPILLAGPPSAGEGGMAAMVVFLFATGVVLAAGSGVETLRRARRHHGRGSPLALPGRVAAGAAVAAVVLSVMLALPGVQFRGSGVLRPPDAPAGDRAGEGGTEGEARRGRESREAAETSASEEGGEKGGREPGRSDAGDDPGKIEEPSAGPAAGLLGSLTSLGEILRIPSFLAVAVLVAVALWRLGPLLAAQRKRPRDLLRRLLDRLRKLLRRRRRPPPPPPLPDPFRDLAALENLPPRQAVAAVYGRFLDLLAVLGHPRDAPHTPLELQNALARRVPTLATPAEQLTDLYLQAAYGDQPVTGDHRRQALALLDELRSRGAAVGSPSR
jgi:hypothetical protein